ncbi:hypothetical protein ABGV42_01655 [Paenibacillus pabuli]|uniref:hypothetical protein n=1 Tax=Paenibacillus pabuli TaxID=1472 RepID=UPI003242687B
MAKFRKILRYTEWTAFILTLITLIAFATYAFTAPVANVNFILSTIYYPAVIGIICLILNMILGIVDLIKTKRSAKNDVQQKDNDNGGYDNAGQTV